VTAPAATVAALPAKREGLAHWWHGFLMMLRWELTNMRLLLPLTVVVQILFGAGFVLGIGLFFEEVPLRAALFLSTGATTITLIMVGIVLGPQLVAQQKLAGTYDFLWSLPVPRSAATLAWIVLNMIFAVPGMVVALLVAWWRYGVDFDVSLAVVPAVAATLFTATLLGYAMSHAIPRPEITQLLTQVLIFGILGFSPINYPPENLPAWLANLHEYLPFLPMATVVRGGLTEDLVTDVARSYVVLGIWAVLALGLVALSLGRRK
jgi:ABC-2 type transport system permease protein